MLQIREEGRKRKEGRKRERDRGTGRERENPIPMVVLIHQLLEQEYT